VLGRFLIMGVVALCPACGSFAQLFVSVHRIRCTRELLPVGYKRYFALHFSLVSFFLSTLAHFVRSQGGTGTKGEEVLR
jgi:hypothetical protein